MVKENLSKKLQYLMYFFLILAIVISYFILQHLSFTGIINHSKNYACTEEYNPVCGSNGITYPNPCYAQQDSIITFAEGACPQVCTMEYAPVCGSDGKTYSNACQASNSGIIDMTPGVCDIVCTTQYDPVCGTNGKTYSNSCFAKKAGISEFTPGTCE